MNPFVCVLCWFLAVGMVAPNVLEAQYLDPGTGSIIVQMVIAVVVGTAAVVRIYWSKIKLFVSRFRRSGQP